MHRSEKCFVYGIFNHSVLNDLGNKTNVKQLIKRFIYVGIITAVVFSISTATLTYYYQDDIINRFVSKANEYLNTPVRVSKMSISVLDNFPTLTLVFNDIEIEESDKDEPGLLLKAEKVLITLNPWQIVQGLYTIEGIKIINGFCSMSISENGETNYNILKNSSSSNDAIAFSLNSIQLENIEYSYNNSKNGIGLSIQSYDSKASINAINSQYNIALSGVLYIESINNKSGSYTPNKKVNADIRLNYDSDIQTLTINDSKLNIEGSNFIAKGSYTFTEQRNINIKLNAEKTSLSTISSLLPNSLMSKLSDYENNGEVLFNLTLYGELDKKNGPSLEIEFGLNNTDLRHKISGIAINNASTNGRYIVHGIYDFNNSDLILQQIVGSLNSNPFNGNLTVKDFSNPLLELDFEGDLELNALSQFMTSKDSLTMSGTIALDMQFKGHINDLKSKELSNRVISSGQVKFVDVYIKSNNLKLPLDNLNGALLFNNNDVALENLSGNYGKSDFLLNGLFKNLWSYILIPEVPLGVEARIQSKYFDLDELLSNSKQSEEEYSFKISPWIQLKLNTQIDRLNFKRFQPRNLKGLVAIRDQNMTVSDFQINNMGGSITINGNVDASSNNLLKVNSKLHLDHIHIDSAFYVFENFNQDFLIDKHLKGNVNADIELFFEMDSTLSLNVSSLNSSITTKITGGELNDFDPLQQLSKYVDEDELDHLVFSDLESEVFISDKVIYLPTIEVGTNITSLKVSGTHSFDQVINYKIVTPLRTKKKIDKDEAFGAIEETNDGQSLLYLKITGTTDDYQIAYDKEEVRKKIKSDLKKELEELKNAFKNKGLKKKKKIEISDDYFDWEVEDPEG